MSWWMIFALALIVFFNHYIFLDGRLGFKLPVFVEKMLSYVAPCFMIAMCVPIIFYQQADFRGLAGNVYLYAALFTLVVVKLSQHMLLSVTLSLIFFYALTELL